MKYLRAFSLVVISSFFWSTLVVADWYDIQSSDPYSAVKRSEHPPKECCSLTKPNSKRSVLAIKPKQKSRVELVHQKKSHEFKSKKIEGVFQSPAMDFRTRPPEFSRIEELVHID